MAQPLHVLQGCAALGGGPEAECDDCRGRGAAARTDRGGIADRLAPDLDFAARELSHITAPPPATAPASNHIALVTADGNGVGRSSTGSSSCRM